MVEKRFKDLRGETPEHRVGIRDTVLLVPDAISWDGVSLIHSVEFTLA